MEYAHGTVPEVCATTNGHLGTSSPLVKPSGRWLWRLEAALWASTAVLWVVSMDGRESRRLLNLLALS